MEYRQKASDFEALVFKTGNLEPRQHYQELAQEYHELADIFEQMAAKPSDKEVEQLAERMTHKGKSKL